MSAPNRADDEPDLPRDVLAAVALHALLSGRLSPTDGQEKWARLAYQFADAMLSARTAK